MSNYKTERELWMQLRFYEFQRNETELLFDLNNPTKKFFQCGKNQSWANYMVSEL